VRFLSRFITGLSRTEGTGSAYRVVPTLLQQAGGCSPDLAKAVLELIERQGLAPWSALVAETLKGISKRRSDLAVVASVVFSRIALPFLDDPRRCVYAEAARSAPSEDRQAVVDHAAACIEVDADAAMRLQILDELDRVAKSLDLTPPRAALDRWRTDRAPSRDERNEGQFYGLRSLDELSATLDGNSSLYGAIQAFERLAPFNSYDQIKRLMAHPQFAEDQRAMVIAARAAIAVGETKDAQSYADKLRAHAEVEGSWGEWQSGAKSRLHTILVALEGNAARERAFDAFVGDLSRGREWMVSLLPDLASVFGLLSPRPSFAAMWENLKDHLASFREYQLGEEVASVTWRGDEEGLIAEMLFLAVDLASSEINHQVRLAAGEIVGSTGGFLVVRALLDRLLLAGGDWAVEGARIAWDLRNNPGIKEYLGCTVDRWGATDDLGRIRYGMNFSKLVGRPATPQTASLSSFYRLILPVEGDLDDFEPPSGFSSTAPGLWSANPITWTWPIRRPLKILADGSRFSLAILRRRAAAMMQRDGGEAAFGPEALKARMARLERLDLKIIYKKTEVTAGFRAAREVAGELFLAGELDTELIPRFLSISGGPDMIFPARVPQPRPAGIRRPSISIYFMRGETEAWFGSLEDALYWPETPGWHLLGSATRLNRPRFDQNLWNSTYLFSERTRSRVANWTKRCFTSHS